MVHPAADRSAEASDSSKACSHFLKRKEVEAPLPHTTDWKGENKRSSQHLPTISLPLKRQYTRFRNCRHMTLWQQQALRRT